MDIVDMKRNENRSSKPTPLLTPAEPFTGNLSTRFKDKDKDIDKDTLYFTSVV